jgi:hypothetical protein
MPYSSRKRNHLNTRNLRLVIDSLEDRSLPTTIWADSTVPAIASVADNSPIELGVRFRSDESGYVSGVRFYKGAGNTGFHVGHIWTSDGTLLGTATFTAETTTGWQEAEFDTPIAVAANTTYVASYYAPAGGYAFNSSYFTPTGVDSPPLHALANGADGANGLFEYGPDGFPTDSNQAGNYWVDVQFSTSSADTTPPRAVPRTPAAGATGVGLQPAVSASFSESVSPTSLTFALTGPGGTEVPATVNYDDASRVAVLTPTAELSPLTSYTASLMAVDLAGNPMAVPLVWSFTTGDPARLGEWSAPVDWPLVAINTVLLDNGKVLMWDGGGDCIGSPSARVWDPATGDFTSVPVDTRNDKNDIFCTGMAALPDGRVLVVGGHDCSGVGVGTKRTNIFDPATGEWTPGPDMTYARWYPTATALPDGKVLVTGGSDAGNAAYDRLPEVYDPATNKWTVLQTAGAYIPAYPFIYVLPDGRVLEAGSTEYDGTAASPVLTRVLDLKTRTWTTVDASHVDGGSSVMYLPGKVMKSGSSYEANTATNAPASAATYVLDMTAANPTWVQTAPMNYGRAYQNLTILPDGTVLATGGTSIVNANELAPAVRAAEVWDPTTQVWTTLADEQVPRVYHSTALLLPDGRVLVAGGGRNFGQEEANELNAELYSPPYLFRGPRPAVTGTPSAIAFDSEFVIQTPDAYSIRSVALVRTGADTHSFNEDQRYVPLTFHQTAGGLVADAPADGNTAPPGNYMLFVVNADGVPSIAPVVRLTSLTVSSTSPAFGATRVDPATPDIIIGFGAPVDPATISADTVSLLDPSGSPVPATVSYDSSTNSAVLVPANMLAASTTYTILVRGNASGSRVANPAGDPLAADFVSYFRTTDRIGTQAYSLWPDSTVPSVTSVNDQGAVSLGVKFQSDVPGYVTGIRFYKGAGNTGTHVGHLWDAAGDLLGSVTFSGESATGWQTATFATPIAVRANTTYVASYYAPEGGYAVDTAYFTAGVDRGPLHGLARGYGNGWVSASNTFPTDGPNGLFRYGTDGDPTDSNNASNYWVDVLFTNATGPAVTTFTPGSGATGVSPATTVTATFSEPVDPGSIGFVLQDSAGNQLRASIAYDAASLSATLTPASRLQSGARYTATVRDAVNLAGYPQAVPVSWSFSVGSSSDVSLWSPAAVPAVASANDGGAVEVGVRFTAAEAGAVTGIRFYKGAGNTGTHVGHLWDTAGDLLGSVTFSGESATGWQTATFATPVAVQPGAAYVVSYYAPAGHYAYDLNYFTQAWTSGPLTAPASTAAQGNGLYRYGGGFPTDTNGAATNYWVDLAFTAADTVPPSVIAQTPAPDANGVSIQIDPTAAFSEPIQSSTLTFALTDAAGATVPATVTYDPSTQTATLTPTAPLRPDATYTAAVSGAQDLAGNTMTPVSWSFTTEKRWLQSTAADFDTGTASGTTVTMTGDGSVALADRSDDFSGTVLDGSQWSEGSWTGLGGGTTNIGVSGGILTVSGGVVSSVQPAFGAAVEARMEFAPQPGQHFGLATGLATAAGNSWALFSTWGTSDTLFARVDVAGSETNVSLGAIPAGYHVYRVTPVSTGYAFSIDGVVVETVAGAIPSPEQMSVVFSDFFGAVNVPLLVDSVTIFSYPGTATFTSAVFDAGSPAATWGTASWTAIAPPGTGVIVQTRTTDNLNAGWSNWEPVSNGGVIASPAGRYIQYRLTLTTSDPTSTPELLDISVTWL